ncbi:MAG TPA: Spx/MgsR family RNA polymerase-binding regulatory protein [Gammaproteobacteria bacterium]|nr:Spx/MgsR family RNA polymerase-binding regulatory protein [Gammaproteobacteria bacterium]
MMRMWGLGNCDTCRRAKRWLEQHDLEFEFRDLREQPPESGRLSAWLKAVGAEALINRRGTTWRGLSAAAKQQIEAGDCVPVLARHPSLMKRPILECGKQLLIGFDMARYGALKGTHA